MRRHRNEKLSFWKKLTISLILFSLGCILLINGFKQQIEPNIDAVSKLKAKGMITEIVNQTIKEDFSGKEYEENLFIIKSGKDDKVQMVQSNTSLINRMVAEFSVNLQKKYDNIEPRTVKLSYGTLVGSKLLSEADYLNVNLKIMPLSVTNCDFETEFESQGINQTKYKIYITIESNVRVLQPFSAENFKIKNKMLISEVVIVGEVPDSYVNVPENNILDALDLS